MKAYIITINTTDDTKKFIKIIQQFKHWMIFSGNHTAVILSSQTADGLFESEFSGKFNNVFISELNLTNYQGWQNQDVWDWFNNAKKILGIVDINDDSESSIEEIDNSETELKEYKDFDLLSECLKGFKIK